MLRHWLAAGTQANSKYCAQLRTSSAIQPYRGNVRRKLGLAHSTKTQYSRQRIEFHLISCCCCCRIKKCNKKKRTRFTWQKCPIYRRQRMAWCYFNGVVGAVCLNPRGRLASSANLNKFCTQLHFRRMKKKRKKKNVFHKSGVQINCMLYANNLNIR